jgi:SAM-dependent methyltransferase
MAQPYYSEKSLSAAFHDKITALDPSVRGDVEIYAGLAPPGGSFLELGSGSGRVALALAGRGFSVVGIDLAPAMLAQAEARRAAAAPEVAARVRFLRGDMSAPAVSETFDAVICPFFGLAHLPAGAAWKNVFAAVSRALKPGGFAAFHVPSAERMAAAPPAAPDRPVLRIPADESGRTLLLFVHERTARPAIARFDQVVDYVLLDAAGREERRSRERLTYYAADPRPFAQAAGLEVGEPAIPMGETGHIQLFRKPAQTA